jgi:hypothetical protein
MSRLAILLALTSASPQPVPPEVNGTYVLKGRYTENTLMILSVGEGEIRVGLHATEEYDLGPPHQGRGAHYGELYGTAKIANGSARFAPLRTEGCTIELQFDRARVVLKQEGRNADCGLGYRIAAEGVYIRRDRKPPHITYRVEHEPDPFQP